MKKLRWVAALVAVAILAAVGVRTDWFGLRHEKAPTPGVARVGTDGGTFTFPDGLTITVPKGAVPDGSVLKETAPVVLGTQDDGPFKGFRKSGVRFDVSLQKSDGTVTEPTKPLEMTIPIHGGAFAPSGARALPYTPDQFGKGYLLLPTKTSATALRVSVAHLSPKYVAYVSDRDLLASFFPEKVEKDRGECKQSLAMNGQNVKMGDASRGWSLKDDSAIFACLAAGSDGLVRIDVTNRIDYILSVAATSNIRLAASSGTIEEELTKSTADVLFPKAHLKKYLVSDGKLVGSAKVNELPATIELQGDPNTFLAEGTWHALEFLLGFLTGTEGNKAADKVGKLLDNVHVASCLQKAVNGKSLQNFGDALGLVSTCLGVIADVLYVKLKPLVILDWLAEMANTAWDTGIGFVNGIKLTLANTLRVQVELEAPACPTDDQIKSAVRADPSVQRDYSGAAIKEVVRQGSLTCQDGWAVAPIGIRYADSAGPNDLIGFSGVFHWIQGGWNFAGGGQDMTGDPLCDQVPPKVRAHIYCG